MRTASDIVIKRVADRGTRRDWLTVPQIAYCGDPHWVRPLDVMEKDRISAKHNIFFTFGEAEFFVAYRGGTPAGRISAQVNRRHLQQHGDDTGQFGFFDCIDDLAVATALVREAERWLASRGLKAMRGPFNLTINQDSGLLVHGFEHRPAIMTSHAGPWSGPLLEACGLEKVVDLLAYRLNPKLVPDKVHRLAELTRASRRIAIRNVDLANYKAEARLLFDIFNDAWSENWGYVPIADDEADALARELRSIIRSKFVWIVEVDGVAAAMMVVLPDLNEVIPPFSGRLLPFNWAKLAYAIWRDDWRTARIPLLGLRKAFHGSPLAMGVLSLLVSGLRDLGQQYQIDWIEFSWILETNRPMVSIAELATGKAAKTYRVYGKAIERPDLA